MSQDKPNEHIRKVEISMDMKSGETLGLYKDGLTGNPVHDEISLNITNRWGTVRGCLRCALLLITVVGIYA